MIKVILISIGVFTLLLQQSGFAMSTQTQFILFIIGIILFGIPHGAADLLVANKNADNTNLTFSKIKFFANYLGRLFLFACIIYLFPIIGIILFLIFAAYHFGETDLYHVQSNTLIGKLFTVSYGFVILSILLLTNINEVKVIVHLSFVTNSYENVFIWLSLNKFFLLSCSVFFFFVCTFLHFLFHKSTLANSDYFLVQMIIVLFLLYNLPLILGFTFYFVIWHSLLSLQNIFHYIRKDNSIKVSIIYKQIFLFSSIAIVGTSVFGLAGFMFANNTAVTGYVFVGLAVLTAPHMEIMHSMYFSVRNQKQMPIIQA
jgi:beta-carotene 15,15'-dioxygenase